MSLYEKLGVSSSASKEEIKAAYQKKISQCHPDRGGSASDAAEVNDAYNTLSDDFRRRQYDATGSSSIEQSMDAQVTDLLCGVFQQMLSQAPPGMFVDYCKQRLLHEKNMISAVTQNQTTEILMLRKKQASIKTPPDKRNLVEFLINQRISGIQAAMSQNEKRSLLLDEAVKVVDYYTENCEFNTNSSYIQVTLK